MTDKREAGTADLQAEVDRVGLWLSLTPQISSGHWTHRCCCWLKRFPRRNCCLLQFVLNLRESIKENIIHFQLSMLEKDSGLQVCRGNYLDETVLRIWVKAYLLSGFGLGRLTTRAAYFGYCVNEVLQNGRLGGYQILHTVVSYSNESVSFNWEWPILQPSSLYCSSFLVVGKSQTGSSLLNNILLQNSHLSRELQ